MHVKVLGPLEVVRGEGPVALGGPKQRTVLAQLIVRVNDLVPADVLIDQVWGEEPPEAARGTLHGYISHLRKAVGADRIEGRPPGYVLHATEEELDSVRFERLLREARLTNGSPGRAGSILREALTLWTGPAFADLSSEPSLAAEIARLDELHLQALEERIAADLAEGRQGEVVGELEALTRELPLRERLWELLMLALYRSRRPADALAAFVRARDGLARELGVDPSPDLRRLHERILREDPDLDLEGEPLRGYRLLEQVGEGAFGVVYRAIQPQVGREVAVKAVHPELANHPDFVRRFEREAQIVARLEHPHVVPLYDYWREPDAAYLVMRFLRGGSVEDLLEAGPLEPSRIVQVTEEIASALAAAHRQGVVHRDVKPGNVLLDEEGNAYLTDFGVALDAGSPERSTGTMMRGTPAYLSPEQIRLEPASPRSDVYALGLVVYEMLTGEHPFPESSLTALLDRHVHDAIPSVRTLRPDLPAEVDAVIGRATAKDAGDRFPEITMIAAELRAALEGTRVPVEATGPVRNPYKGLRAFLEADAADFFGREAVTERLIRSLAADEPAARFLAVVGPSGSGKSSVVRAGLVPALRHGALPGSERWYVTEVIPGSRPFRELEAALMSVAVEPPPSLMDELEHDELGLVRAVDRILPDPQAELVIILDQLEEVFTLVADEVERARLLASVHAAALEAGSRLRVVATLRADFYDAPLSVPGFGDLLAARTEAITPMSPEELERAIVAPAEQAGLAVEPRLLAEMISDVAHRAGALPLLQYALTELAGHSADRVLSLDAYRRIGGLSGALVRRAEELFDAASESGRDACRQLFLRLVTLGGGTDETRRRVRRSELLSLADESAMDGVIETFGRHRLLSFDRDPDTREPTVEIAHEALLREWARFRGWIEEAREDMQLSAKISSAAVEWLQVDRSAEFLLSGTRLAQAEEANLGDAIRLTVAEREYVDASVAKREAERKAERSRHSRELALERRARTRLRGFVALLAVATLVATTLTAVALNRTREAERGRREATAAQLTQAVITSLETDPDVSLQLALYAVAMRSSLDEPVPAETVEALQWALQANGIEYPVRDGATAIVDGPSGTRGVFDLPLPALVELALAQTDRSLTPQECDRYFGSATCPSLPKVFPARIPAEPIHKVDPATAGKPLSGTSVSIIGEFGEPFATDFRTELDRISAATGISFQFDGLTDFERRIPERVEAGNPPDIAVFPEPGFVQEFARDGFLMDLSTYLDIDQLRQDFSPYLVSLGTVSRDGTWPSNSGDMYGAMLLVQSNLMWYPVPELEAAGYNVPRTWQDLIRLSARIRGDGQSPWCMGFSDGIASGHPGTNWIENLLLTAEGPATYDDWTSHRIPFASAQVRRAFERFGDVAFPKGSLYLGTDSVLNSLSPYETKLPMVETDPPQCWLDYSPSYTAASIPSSLGTETATFDFPTVDPEFRDTLVGGGIMAVAFSDRPEVREVMKRLLDPRFGERWIALDPGVLSANRHFNLRAYPWFLRPRARQLEIALANDSFRFDGSDIMPIDVQFAFWGAMMTYLREGPKSLDRILSEIDAAWPADG